MKEEDALILASARKSFDVAVCVPTEAMYAHCRQSSNNSSCLERPERLQSIMTALNERAILSQTRCIPTREITVDELHLVHSDSYLESLSNYEDSREEKCMREDMFISETSIR